MFFGILNLIRLKKSFKLEFFNRIFISLHEIIIITKMLRTIYTPDTNRIIFPIPDKYIGSELEILVFPVNEISVPNIEKGTSNVDVSFGAWATMDKTTEEICSEIKSGSTFKNRDIL